MVTLVNEIQQVSAVYFNSKAHIYLHCVSHATFEIGSIVFILAFYFNKDIEKLMSKKRTKWKSL